MTRPEEKALTFLIAKWVGILRIISYNLKSVKKHKLCGLFYMFQ